MKIEIDRSLALGINYLLRKQADDGHWEDYVLPVGVSNAWVTAYVALALAEIGNCRAHCSAIESARRAAKWLAHSRPYPAGWGYNEQTGPDADSTAYSLSLFRAVEQRVEERDVSWLLHRWQPDGGFATYEHQYAWGVAHADVTPLAFAALPSQHQAALRVPFIDYSIRNRWPDGTWPAYWWRTCHYSTYWNLAVLRTLGWDDPEAVPVVTMEETHAIHSAFDLAFVIGIALVGTRNRDLALVLASELLHLQLMDGSWPGGSNLRVTEPECYRPWEHPTGILYEDIHGLITTASAVRILGTLD